MKRSTYRSAFKAGAVTPHDVLAFHRRAFGNARMEGDEGGDGNKGGDTPPEQPEGVSDAEWAALGDPGKKALVRERERAAKAEQDLAALRSRQAQPQNPSPPAKAGDGDPQPKDPAAQKSGETPDLSAIIEQAVQAAIKPFQEREEQREVQEAAQRVQDAVVTAAKARFHDATDALANVDLTAMTNGEGRPDEAKITAALDDLLTKKPYMAKLVDDRRHAAPGSPVGGGQAGTSTDQKVQAALERMQHSSGIRLAEKAS